MPADPGASTPSDGTICVLWTAPAPDAPPPEPPRQLADLLAQRGFTIQIAAGPHLAMARACRAAAAGTGRTIVILDRPNQLPRLQEVIQALQGYAPDVHIWAYDPARRPNLAAFAPEPGPNEAGAPAVPTGSRAAPAPLRLVGDGPGPREPDGEREAETEPHSVLSPEELEMLLAEEER